jgi:integrase
VGRKKQGYSGPVGLIKQAGSNIWYIKIHINGRAIYKSAKTDDLQKAELILAKVKVALLSLDSQVNQIIGKSILFSELWERYSKEVSHLKRSFDSESFRSTHLVEYFGDRKIDTITTQDVYKYQDQRKSQISAQSGKPLAGATVNREIALLRHVMKKAIRWGYIEKNPAAGIEGFSENRRTRYITHEELKAIKAAAKRNDHSRHLCDIIDALYLTAQRSGKILTLKWRQIDLDQRTISFEQSAPKNKGTPIIIWINDPLLVLLNKLKLIRSSYPVISHFVFRKPDGVPYKSVNKAWQTACQKAGVKDARIHDIRHKSITDMVEAGFSLEFVGRVAGHTTPATTQRYTIFQSRPQKQPLKLWGVQNC